MDDLPEAAAGWGMFVDDDGVLIEAFSRDEDVAGGFDCDTDGETAHGSDCSGPDDNKVYSVNTGKQYGTSKTSRRVGYGYDQVHIQIFEGQGARAAGTEDIPSEKLRTV